MKKELFKQFGEVNYYYIHGNCRYECKYKGDSFELTNGYVEMTKSESQLLDLNKPKVSKHYYK